ncbi:MAG: DUF1015 family protein [Micromonosporaceae bacterium]
MLAPFRGVRYVPQRVSGLADVTSPPYDVVGADALVRLRDADPHNVVRLTLPADPGGHEGRGPDARYRSAGRTLRHWIAEGVLLPDQSASLYVYEDHTDGSAAGRGARVQRGLIGALALSPPEAGIVLPHEDVTPVVVADRCQLMEATEANLEPIFLLYEGGGAASQLVDEVASAEDSVIEAETDDGVTHRLWAVTDPSRVAAAAADLATRHAMIADGHHRYAAYLDLQARRHAQGFGPGPWDYGLALLVDSRVYPPHIGPIHRAIPGLPPATAIERAAEAFTVTPLPRGTGMAAALRALRDAGQHSGGWRDWSYGDGLSDPEGGDPGADRDASGMGDAGVAGGAAHGTAFLLAGDGGFHLLTDPDPKRLAAAAPAGRSERWLKLDTSVLHELLIRTLWQIPDDGTAVRIVHHDPLAAIEAAGACGTAVLCNPLPVSDVLAVAAGGERVPRKSTSFGPKPRTGLVIRSFAYG